MRATLLGGLRQEGYCASSPRSFARIASRPPPGEQSEAPGVNRALDMTTAVHLLRQPHLELDGGQLLGRLADALQERQPARVVVDVGE